jgi:4-hydroxybenzoate polyprenyltransferase
MESGSLKATVRMLGPIAWIALAAGLQILGALMFFRAPIDVILVFTGASITFSVYLLNRFTDDEDSYNCPEQKILFQQKRVLIFIPISLFVLSFLLLAFSGRLVAWHIVLFICGIFYSVSFIPVLKSKSVSFIRIKDIFFIKNILVSFLWGITPFILAGSFRHTMPPRSDFIVVVSAFCLTALINSTSCDVRDLIGDRLAGIVTFANYFGKKFTAFCLCFLGAAGCLAVGINHYAGHIGIPATLFFYVTVLWSGIVASPIYFSKLQLPRSVIEPLNDSQVVFNGISLIVLSLCV